MQEQSGATTSLALVAPGPVNFVFCVRTYGDIDHFIPVVDRLCRDFPCDRVRIVDFDPSRQLRDDFRVRFLLKNHSGVEVMRVLDEFTECRDKRGRDESMGPSARLVANIGEAAFLRHVFGAGRGTIIFGHQVEEPYTRLTHFANRNGFRTLSFPHGVPVFDNELVTEEDMAPDENSLRGVPPPYQEVVLPNHLIGRRLIRRGFLRKSQVKVLGSPRFCREWNERLRLMLPPFTSPWDSRGKIKVLLFLTDPKYNVFLEEVGRVIEFVQRFPETLLVVKPHTGQGAPDLRAGENVHVAGSEIPSPALIDWADVVLFTGTSVVLDAIERRKPVLFLKRTIMNRLVVERFLPRCAIECRDDLRQMLRALASKGRIKTYNEAERQHCLRELVEPEGRDVLGQYVRLLHQGD